MEFLNKRNSIIIGGAIIVLVVIAAFFFTSQKSANNGAGSVQTPPPAPPPFITREAPSANVVVPSQNTPEPANVAVPKVVSQGSPTDNSVKYRSFTIRADQNRFMPDTVIVRAGDTIDLNITAVDKNYDFTQPDFGFKAVIGQGTAKRIEFSATVAGKFTFYCTSCGGPSSGPLGYIIISDH